MQSRAITSDQISITFKNYLSEVIDQVEIQSKVKMEISFNSYMPIPNGECYLEVKFPKEFPLEDPEPYSFRASF